MANSEQAKKLNTPQSIVMWGPDRGGKDWLLCAFPRELELFYKKEIPLRFGLFERIPGMEELAPMTSHPPVNIPGNSIMEIKNFIFKRESILNDPSQQINAQVHDVLIYNSRPTDFLECLDFPENDEISYKILTEADNIILVLDIPIEIALDQQDGGQNNLLPNISGLLQEKHNPRSWERPWDKQTYLIYIQKLLGAIRIGPRKNLAVCINKIDQYESPQLSHPWDMLGMTYGKELVDLLERNKQKHNIEVFATSAAGYIRRNEKFVPNFMAGSLIDPARWEPVNTAQPFFWIFEGIERERLASGPLLFRRSNLKNYIPYPAPR